MASSDRVTQAGYSAGLSGMSQLTLPRASQVTYEPPGPPDGGGTAEMGNPLIGLFAVAAGIFGLWLIRNQSEHLQRNVMGVNIFNLLLVTFTAVLGIVLFKFLFTRFPVPGFTPLFHAV